VKVAKLSIRRAPLRAVNYWQTFAQTKMIAYLDNMTTHQLLNYLIAAVWLANGLFCKVLNLVPRHQQIVARILGKTRAGFFTKAIGLAEIAMAIWILSGALPKPNAIIQIVVIATMNLLECILVPDLLLWGTWNAFFACLFLLLIFYNEFGINLH
jgi:hypothetical protein